MSGVEAANRSRAQALCLSRHGGWCSCFESRRDALGAGQESHRAGKAREPDRPYRRRMRHHHEGQPEQEGGDQRRANLAPCDRGRHGSHDPRERSGHGNDPRVADNYVVPEALDRVRDRGALPDGASLPCWTKAPMASPITLS